MAILLRPPPLVLPPLLPPLLLLPLLLGPMSRCDAGAVTTPVGPVIGILTQNTGEDAEVEGRFDQVRGATVTTYIAASYVKYIESAGGRVVPIHYDTPPAELTALFHKINGILLPGGATDLRNRTSTYVETLMHLWTLAIAANDNHDFFPVWGTCLGFETINMLAAGADASVLTWGYDSSDLALPLTLTPDAMQSELVGSAPQFVLDSWANYNSTMNNHVAGVAPETMQKNDKLRAFFKVLSTNKDRKGKTFVSMVEGHTYPVYGTQWHPDKAVFEWTDREHIPHTIEAVTVAQYTANFFVNKARSSMHRFDYDELTKKIIYNDQPTYSFLQGSNFDQIYTWRRPAV